MKERIKQLRAYLKMNQTDFGERIGVKQTTVAGYESGIRIPSDAVMLSICREFGVREEWLRTGEEPMMQEVPQSKKIAAFLGDLMREEDGSFKKQLIEILSEMSLDEWELLERMARRLTGH